MTTTLPAELLPDMDAFKALGFSFGEDVMDGPYPYIQAELPAGWSTEDNGYRSPSFIKDEMGRERVEYYRQEPHPIWSGIVSAGKTELLRRYTIAAEYEPSGTRFGDLRLGVRDRANAKMILVVGIAPRNENGRLDWAIYEKLHAQASLELNATFPLNRNPLAYW
jgi:hypothetical protein